MHLNKEDNYIIDKNRIESVNKYIYTKFPTFDLHKKVKNYNNKISELMTENEKLKKYKSNLEKRIIRGNENFEVNFMKYELAISNALRIGYSCIYLCNSLNKIIDRYKMSVLRELLRRRDQFKSNLIKSYMNKNSYDKLFINSMVMKIEGVYERNRHFVTTFLVILVKNKLRDIFKLFICNVLGIPTWSAYTFNGLSSGKENSNRVISSRRANDRYVELTMDERIQYTSGFIKLMDILKSKFYGTVRVCFISLKRHNDEYDMYARGMWKSFPLSKRERIQFNRNSGDAKKSAIGNCVRDKGNSRNDKPFRSYDSLVGQKLIAKGDIEDDRSNLEFGRSSSSIYLPHPSDVYNYLYYQEMLNIKDKLSSRLMDDENSDLVNYIKFMQTNGEVYCLKGNEKEGGSSIGNVTKRSTVIGNTPIQSWLPQSDKRTHKEVNEIDRQFSDEVGKVPNDINIGFHNRGGDDGHRGKVVSFSLSDEEGNPNVDKSSYEQKKRVGFNLRRKANYTGSEGLRKYESNEGEENILNGSGENGGRVEFMAHEEYSLPSREGEAHGEYYATDGNYTVDGKIKTMASSSNMEKKFRSIMSEASEGNDNNPEDESYESNENFCEQSIVNIKKGLSRIQDKNFIWLVGEGPPDDLEVNPMGQYYLGEDEGYGMDVG
ncbi:conserved Plasmodium protein, unknown function [Plasmodium knowlesi strain H]|uniref:Uncharacterized protein n=3 Tax=Plasmodium knowlesi TaxID=5850 RepID=A0A5K1VMH2_PLAKH|nr:conserved Plasmodium protein, unknown function [Plasmodium knowlesi strain H]OTN65247.1 Uncharacterized protein PKNOH_S120159500 [Plasmodium knowlesi]CAA9988451.1 conserved Plasmodium protein, unknown function [Plasmodium knowlesi strain H]SBO19828.1 conserved Plasmodium protein, unknown function [Plasmodium knowlesi strain H]SBO20445.1 conserved Plasmodium protein, unknown function [Plasmodium knowlesi strain H]VVS77925.1 conserved Plasmodium protein, unknown function [Plasmodium knowlesi |eukprot:XP_002259432.1 hypothetical protein, conserved in Plasmodium species [Plasmodium knowlesi strain H]